MSKQQTKWEPSFRLDLLLWQQQRNGDSYGSLARKADLSKQTVWNVMTTERDPSVSTIKKIFEGAGLDPKFALDFKLEERQFRRAVIRGTVR